MTSLFWRGLFENLGTQLNFSLAYHPQTDGQSEIVNSVILDLLKCYMNEVDQRNEWKKYLPLVEYAYNNNIHTSTSKAPFEVMEDQSFNHMKRFFPSISIVKTLKNLFKRLKTLYQLCKRDKRLLRISTKGI